MKLTIESIFSLSLIDHPLIFSPEEFTETRICETYSFINGKFISLFSMQPNKRSIIERLSNLYLILIILRAPNG